MAAKELGMIHTTNFTRRVQNADSNYTLLDLSGQLTQQLQRMVRQGNYFKIVGIDMGLHSVAAGGVVTTDANVSGELRYYAPTQGRCAAYRAAFKAMAEAMKTQGITMRDNHFYDFRVSTRDSSLLTNDLDNCASFDGVTELTLNGASPNGVFQVYNEGIQPVQLAATFSEGFGVFGNAGNDFVVNENTQGFTGTEGRQAELEFETIPFNLTYTSNADSAAVNFQWRPDPALFLAVMTGMFELHVENATVAGSQLVDLEVNIMTSGWKSIMGDPKTSKRRRSRAASKKKE